MTSMSGDVPNERWEGDLEADQLDDIAAREEREDAGAAPDAFDARPASARDASHAGPTYDALPVDDVSNERWEADIEADELDREAAEEGADERDGGPL